MIRIAICAMLLAASATAMANQQKVALDEGNFAKQRAEIERDLADGKTYAEISSSDRSKVQESLTRIGSRLEGVDSVDSLDMETKVEVFNEQEVVNNILTQAAADSRLVCDRDVPTGSRMRKTTCQTVAERNRRAEADREHLRKVQNGIGPPNN